MTQRRLVRERRWLEARLRAIASALRRRAERAGVLLPRTDAWDTARWNAAYHEGRLDYFGDINEVGRYSLLAGYVRHLGGTPSILDVGCGSGTLRDHLAELPFSRYVGVDIAEAGIALAAARADSRTTFVVGDITSMPLPAFDVVVLNEVLYFVPDVAILLRRVDDLLLPGGVVLSSIWRHRGDQRIWRQLDREFLLVDRVELRNRSSALATHGWRVACHRSARSFG
jgi:SAM-dependent methyltransferase